ncbi:hypothetical protein KP509_36G017000 [Ceratopteris richardii]|nr:hypothetical protein KP509_36G017000 [Ceratopteris richardii]
MKVTHKPFIFEQFINSQQFNIPHLQSPELVTILLSCAENKNLVQGRYAHAYIITQGLHLDFRVANALIHMYGYCGVPEDAQKVFERMHFRNVISWNNLLGTYAHAGPSRRALDLFVRMQHDKFTPNRISILMVIFACASNSSLSDGRQIHAHILGTAYEHDVVLRTALVNMYGKCGSVYDAWRIFEGSIELDIVAWNAIMSVYSQHGMAKEALGVLLQMQQQGELPNRVSIVNVVSACANNPSKSYSKWLHAYIVGSGLEQNLIVGNALINMHGKSNNLDIAIQTYDRMHSKDIISWNALISAYARSDRSNMAHQLFIQMYQEGILPNKVTFVVILDACSDPNMLSRGRQLHTSAIVSGFQSDIKVKNALANMYGMCRKLEDALRIFNEMPEHSTIGFLTVVSACVNQEAISEGTLLHAYIIETGSRLDIMLGNALVNLYSKCGRLYDARDVFDALPEKNVITWTTIIDAYAQHGHGIEAIDIFDKMQEAMVKPNAITFVNLLTACSHAGLVEEGHAYFRSMVQKYDIEPSLDHYHCMIDLLARSGRLNEAENMLYNMPFEASATSWMIILSFCKKEADITIAEWATEQIIKLDSNSTAAYVMLSNVYLSACREDLALVIQQQKMLSEQGTVLR